MKILVVIPHLASGGAERVASRLSCEWAKSNDVTVAVFDGRDVWYDHGGRLIDLKVPPVPGRLGKAAQLVRRAARLGGVIRELGPDRIVSFTESANFPSLLACLLTGTRHRLTLSVRASLVQFPTSLLRLMRLAYRFSNLVVAPSQGIRNDLNRLLGKSVRIKTVNNPLDLARIADLAMAEPDTELPGGRFIVGVGRLSPEKGFDLLLEAFAQIDHSEVELLILGEGPQRGELNAAIERLGLQGRARLVGQVQNPYPVLRRAAAFVLPSRAEGYPNALIEAMACGCTVVAFNCPHGPAEILANGARGILVEAQSVTGLKQAIDAALAPTGWDAERHRGVRRYLERLDVSGIGAEWLAP